LQDGRFIRSGASGLPYYCAPLVCVSDVIESLAVWRHNKPKTKNQLVNGNVRSYIINGLGAGAVGGGGNPSLVSSMPPGVVPGPVDSVSAPPSSGRGNYLPTQYQTSYHSASSSPWARRPSSGFDSVNDEANVRANAAVVDGHADVRASADNDDDADDSNLDDILSEILGASFRVANSLDLDLTFGAVDVNNDLACTSLLSPLSPLPPPVAWGVASPPPSTAAGETMQEFFIGGCLMINFFLSLAGKSLLSDET